MQPNHQHQRGIPPDSAQRTTQVSHTIQNPGTLEPGVSTRQVITEFADLPEIGTYCIIYDEVERVRSEEE